MFELTLCVRNHLGKPTGKTRHIITCEASKLADFYVMNTSGRKPRRKQVKLNPKPID